jgi:Sel1 repeat
MSERLSPDRRSFQQFLSFLFQQIQMPGLRGSVDHRIDLQLLSGLTQIRQEVKGGRFDLNTLINRLTRLIQGVVGADGTGVWLFTADEVFLYAGVGTASNDERLRLEVISKLRYVCKLTQDSASRLLNQPAIATGYDASNSGDRNSLLVEPIHQGPNVAGALAVLSNECNAFTERDVTNLHALADLLGQALCKAADAGLQESIALNPAAMLQLIERIIPTLRRMLESDVGARHSTHRFLQREPCYERPSAGIDTKQFPESHQSNQETGTTEAMGGTRTGLDQEPPLENLLSSSVVQKTSAPRIGLWGALKSKVAERSAVWPLVCQKWQSTVALVSNCAPRTGLTMVAPGSSRHAQDSILHAVKITATRLQKLLYPGPSLGAFLKVAPVMAILAIVITFLIPKTGLHLPAQTPVFSSRTNTRENTLSAAKSDTRDTPGAEPFAMPAAIQVSHLHITDRATEAAVRILSYYEMAGLRRRAEYGDDSAAFQMGMAYEIGHGVPQRCTTAAQWVARAAGEDNAAAQYNLGLRYRDGDGVAVDEDEAVKWLKKAASKQNSDAQVALGALTAHQARVVPSSQTSH